MFFFLVLFQHYVCLYLLKRNPSLIANFPTSQTVRMLAIVLDVSRTSGFCPSVGLYKFLILWKIKFVNYHISRPSGTPRLPRPRPIRVTLKMNQTKLDSSFLASCHVKLFISLLQGRLNWWALGQCIATYTMEGGGGNSELEKWRPPHNLRLGA